MTKRIVGALLLLLLVAPGWQSVRGCGDKLLLVGRGVKFRSTAALRPASLLAYLPADSASVSPFSDPRLLPALKEAGGQLRVVGTPDEFTAALHAGKVDVVLAQSEDAGFVEQRLGDVAGSSPAVVLVLREGVSKNEMRDLERRYGAVLRVPAKPAQFVSTMEKALASKNRLSHAAGGGQ